jgi:diketogulonate reductase-like aldo/keto reductase
MALVQPVKPFSLKSKKKLNDNHRIPRIQLGVYQTSGRECYAAVTAALNAGYRAIDSAEWYGNEEEVGAAIVRFLDTNTLGVGRQDIWFTTKLKTNSSYDETKLAIDRSIRKSGLGYIDLYLLHSPNGGPEARLESWKAIEDAIESRRVKSGGVSNFGVRHVRSPSCC